MAKYKVGYLVGSLSAASVDRRLAKALVRLAPPELAMAEVPIRDLPLYSQVKGAAPGRYSFTAAYVTNDMNDAEAAEVIDLTY